MWHFPLLQFNKYNKVEPFIVAEERRGKQELKPEKSTVRRTTLNKLESRTGRGAEREQPL